MPKIQLNNVTDCGSLPTLPANSQISSVVPPIEPDSTYQIGTVASYQCIAGFQLQGTPTIECLDTAAWEPISFICFTSKF